MSNPKTGGKRKGRTFMPFTQLSKVLSENTSTPHMLDTPQLYFHPLYINSVSENDTQALLQLQVNSGQVTAPLLCKIDTGAEGNVIPVDVYNHLYPQSSYSPESAPLD